MNFTQILEQLGARSQSAAEDIANLYLDGRLSLDEAVDMLTTVLAASNETSVTVGVSSCREAFAALGNTPVADPDLGQFGHYLNTERLQQAARTALTHRDAAVMAVGRLAYSEAVEAAQKSYGATLGVSPAKGYKRGLDADACQLCVWWWRDDRVWPKDYVMPTHKGCACRQIPVVQYGIQQLAESTWKASDRRREQQQKNQLKGSNA